MRITKKFTGKARLGKKLYKECEPAFDSTALRENATMHLKILEARFNSRMGHDSPMVVSHSSSSDFLDFDHRSHANPAAAQGPPPQAAAHDNRFLASHSLMAPNAHGLLADGSGGDYGYGAIPPGAMGPGVFGGGAPRTYHAMYPPPGPTAPPPQYGYYPAPLGAQQHPHQPQSAQMRRQPPPYQQHPPLQQHPPHYLPGATAHYAVPIPVSPSTESGRWAAAISEELAVRKERRDQRQRREPTEPREGGGEGDWGEKDDSVTDQKHRAGERSSPMDSPPSVRPKGSGRRTCIACVACQRVKSKCELPDGGVGACRRCARVGRECEFGPAVAAPEVLKVSACISCRRIKVRLRVPSSSVATSLTRCAYFER